MDSTSSGTRRDPEALLGISRATGVAIIAGCGYYTGDTHPADMDRKTVEQIQDEILTDLTKQYFIDRRDRGFAGGVFARDIERVRAVKALVDTGYLRNLLLANDVCLKTLLHKYGGWGYDHVLTHIVPMLLDEGLTEPEVDVMLRQNPRRLLDVP